MQHAQLQWPFQTLPVFPCYDGLKPSFFLCQVVPVRDFGNSNAEEAKSGSKIYASAVLTKTQL